MRFVFAFVLSALLAGGITLTNPALASAAPAVDQTQTVVPLGFAGPSCSTTMTMVMPMMMMMMTTTTISQGSLFTAGVSGSLTSIEVPLSSTTNSDNLTVQVFNTANGVPTGQPIAQQVIPTSSLSPLVSGGLLTVNFDTPATVTAGTPYAFVLAFPTCASVAQLSFRTGIAPADKRLVQVQNSTNWVVEPMYGISFSTFVEPSQAPAAPAAAVTPAAPATAVLAQTGASESPVNFIWLGFILAGGLALLARQHVARRTGSKQ